ncbi:MAG: hypothetical protein A2Z20_07675 [Bdellovibrionales bacterium RBG_16_40_8]|nr:MAG: hypothetical protein A2Z20_07675 [Bdellovibrionales bacterium RBG_16_40_8]
MKHIILIGSLFLLASCSDKYKGGYGSGAGGLTHDQLASNFVATLNASGEYDVTLVKSSTERKNYIVIYDKDLHAYDAINLSGYTPGADAAAFLNTQATVYSGLVLIPGHYEWYPTYGYGYGYNYPSYGNNYYDSFCNCWTYGPDYSQINYVWIEDQYRDPGSGLTFEKINATSKDLEKISGLAEQKVVQMRAQNVAARFGLSTERSQDVVRLAIAWQKDGGKELTDNVQDSYAKEMLGFSITEAKSAIKKSESGNTEGLDDLVKKAALANDITPEQVKQLIDFYIN